MEIKTLTSDDSGKLAGLTPNAKYAVVELNDNIKFDVQPPAKMATCTRQTGSFSEVIPFPVKTGAAPKGGGATPAAEGTPVVAQPVAVPAEEEHAPEATK